MIPGPRPATTPAGSATVAAPVPPGGGIVAPAAGGGVHPGNPGAPGSATPVAAGPPAATGTGAAIGAAGPPTPPLPWPAITATTGTPVPAVYPQEQPAPPVWRKALDLVDPGRVAGLSTAVRGTVGHRTAAITVGATLALAVGVLVAAYTGTGQDQDAPESAAAPAPAAVPPDLISGTTAADPAAFGATPSFTSPSGNIACRIDGAAARCDVENKRWAPTGADDCTDAGLVVGGTAGSRASCAGTPVPDDGEELGYGTHLTHGDLTCVSRRSGVECRDGRTGHGFTAARASYRLY
ncbi:hypothetical protein SAMN05216207_100623 [Pseudonocardia ammonioxydans]|uniref:Uncharacterized protein n=1 Tax=Pseudonocardia ammonioxydans TaxID=260086 RepID=A0A1I4VFA9_PSUAM|nr:hypothetical protein SAMN05216207_100623 [Pseudonocardia ammonioxydans]